MLSKMVAERQAAVDQRSESQRRLSRYDEAIRLLREAPLYLDGTYPDQAGLESRICAFLAAEPKKGSDHE